VAARGGALKWVPADWASGSTRVYPPAAPGPLGYSRMWWVGQGQAALLGNDYIAAMVGNHVVAVFPALDLVLVHQRQDNGASAGALESFAMVLAARP
jgi:hypothetical protein